MTPPLTPKPDCSMEPTVAAKTTSTQLFGVLYITLTGLVDSVVPNSGPWSLLGQSHPFYGGPYPPARPHLTLSRLMPLPMTGFLTHRHQPFLRVGPITGLGQLVNSRERSAS
ncbi:hypothetical protein DSO57_1035377 [Entomophthora muscae]|uniref:Uncharacterized protein n=1 Tax=Entomophthora muscae TaxID=34485 RepID=A0ACC2RE81_9FUNG|nr:hypothetical protein DSO57_1035377 [Entomophthora muscae]